MSNFAGGFDAVTFDFYNTLACHRTGRGRGHMLMQYLRQSGLDSDPWEHQVLYDVFGPDALAYEPLDPPESRRGYYVRIAEHVFRRLNVRAPVTSAVDHAEHLWRILGPASLNVFPEVPDVLTSLHAAGLPLAIVSNWQCGLRAFCVELGIGTSFRHVLASAEVGYAKPDPEIFHEACRRLGVAPHRVLHVGDSADDDVAGGRLAGLAVMLVNRDHGATGPFEPSIPSLSQLPALLGV